MIDMTLLGTHDAEALRAFYARLGVNFTSEGRRFRGAPYRFEACQLEVRGGEAAVPAPLRGIVCFGVNDVGNAASRIGMHGGSVTQPPMVVGGRRMIAAVDPDGNPFGAYDL